MVGGRLSRRPAGVAVTAVRNGFHTENQKRKGNHAARRLTSEYHLEEHQ